MRDSVYDVMEDIVCALLLAGVVALCAAVYR